VDIHVSDALAMKSVPLYIAERFAKIRHQGRGKLLEQPENQCAIRQGATGNLTDDKWMHGHIAMLEQLSEQTITLAKVIHPH
jgi:hypothetical protein